MKQSIEELELEIERLKDIENEYFLWFENSPVGKSRTMPDGSLNTNKAFADMLGYTLEEMKKLKWQDVTHPDDIEKTDENVDDLYNGKKDVIRFDKRYVHKNGSIVWADLSASLQKDAEGRQFFLANIINITERKNAEEKLLFHSQVLAYLNSGVFLISVDDSMIVYSNSISDKMFGYEEGELLGKNIVELNAPTNKSTEETAANINEQLNKNKVWRGEIKGLRKDGTTFWCNASVTTITHPEFGLVWIAEFTDITDSKQTEEHLRKSEEKYRIISDNASDIIWTMDIKTEKFTYISPSVKKIRGYTPEEAIELSLEKTVTPDSYKKAMKMLKEELENNKNSTSDPARIVLFEYEQICKDGSVNILETRINSIRDANGNAIAIQGISRDITERKKAEEAIIIAAKEWSITFNASPDAISLIHPDGKIFRYNDAMKVLVNKEENGIINHTCWELVHGTAKCIPGCPMAKAAKTRKRESFEILHQGDNWFEVIVDPVLDKDRNVISFIHLIRNITERKNSQEALLESEHRFRTLINENPDGCVLVGRDGCTQYASEKAMKLFGISSIKKGLGRNIMDFAAPEYKKRIAANSVKLLKGKVLSDNKRYLFIKETGEPFYAELNSAPFKDSKGNIVGFISTIRNVGEQVKMENELHDTLANLERIVSDRTSELAEANKKLQKDIDERQKVIEHEKELNLIKSRFISVVSHEFRTPLTGIQSNVQLLQRYGSKWDSGKIHEHFDKIYNSIRFINLLLDDVSIIGRDDSKRINYHPLPCSIKDVCQQALDDVKAAFGKSKVINFSIKPDKIISIADETLLRHILNNILSNAVRFSETQQQVDFSVKTDKKDIVFTIIDHGIGIPQKDMKLVFEPFYRAPNAESIKGTGLGLAIVERCVKLHEGTIEMKSTENKGTTVVVKIPCKKSK